MTFIKKIKDFSGETEVTVSGESDWILTERSEVLYKMRKHVLSPLTIGYFLTSAGPTNTVVTTIGADLTPTPLLASTWTTTSGSEASNMTQSISANRKTITYNAPSGVQWVRHKLHFNGVAIFQKSGGGDTVFDFFITRGGTAFPSQAVRFTLTDDVSYIPVAIPNGGGYNVTANAQSFELAVQRVSGTGDIVLKGCFITMVGLKHIP